MIWKWSFHWFRTMGRRSVLWNRRCLIYRGKGFGSWSSFHFVLASLLGQISYLLWAWFSSLEKELFQWQKARSEKFWSFIVKAKLYLLTLIHKYLFSGIVLLISFILLLMWRRTINRKNCPVGYQKSIFLLSSVYTTSNDHTRNLITLSDYAESENCCENFLYNHWKGEGRVWFGNLSRR